MRSGGARPDLSPAPEIDRSAMMRTRDGMRPPSADGRAEFRTPLAPLGRPTSSTWLAQVPPSGARIGRAGKLYPLRCSSSTPEQGQCQFRPGVTESGRHWTTVGQVSPTSSKFTPISTDVGPKLAGFDQTRPGIDKYWPEIGQMRPKYAENRQTLPRDRPQAARHRSDSTRIDPESTSFGRGSI